MNRSPNTHEDRRNAHEHRRNHAQLATALMLASSIFGSACNYTSPTFPILGYEADNVVCDDGIDNDRDGLIDCEDADCLQESVFCGPIVPLFAVPSPERSIALCTDRVDNDENGQFDCGDKACQAIPELCCGREFTNASCSDGRDNDGNGFIDCVDFGCRRGKFVTVCVENTSALCSDGLDNDGDGDADCADRNCLSAPECRRPENTHDRCKNGVDDDGDQTIDCDDSECVDVPGIQALCDAREPEEDFARCTDRLDNDRDGYVDCSDFSCSRSLVELAKDASVPEGEPRTVGEYCATSSESSLERCRDGIDNDRNGYTDCADFACSASKDPAVAFACQESVGLDCEFIYAGTDPDTNAKREDCLRLAPPENPNQACTDGLDNDLDGFVDCLDWDCSWNPAVTVCGSPHVCE